MTPSELLDRLAITLKTEVGPAVEAEYPRTQAFLGAVVLQKLAAELRLGPRHEEAAQADRDNLRRDLSQLLRHIDAPQEVEAACAALNETDDAGLCRFIEALYAGRGQLGEAHFMELLGRVRQTLRRNLDRQMEIAS